MSLNSSNILYNIIYIITELGNMIGINTLIGSQADTSTLQQWVEISGGKFDVILDDGGHKNHEIITTFNILYHKTLLPGGYYFIEDLQVGRYVLYMYYMCIIYALTYYVYIYTRILCIYIPYYTPIYSYCTHTAIILYIYTCVLILYSYCTHTAIILYIYTCVLILYSYYTPIIHTHIIHLLYSYYIYTGILVIQQIMKVQQI